MPERKYVQSALLLLLCILLTALAVGLTSCSFTLTRDEARLEILFPHADHDHALTVTQPRTSTRPAQDLRP